MNLLASMWLRSSCRPEADAEAHAEVEASAEAEVTRAEDKNLGESNSY